MGRGACIHRCVQGRTGMALSKGSASHGAKPKPAVSPVVRTEKTPMIIHVTVLRCIQTLEFTYRYVDLCCIHVYM